MPFTEENYAPGREGTQRSAAAIVPIVHDLVKPFTVLDMGCGEGWFAREFANLGVECVTAVDPAVQPGDRDGVVFVNNADDDLIDVDAYDLAVCLEVAEHLPEESAPELVASLCEVAEVVLFSAAIPGQTGHEHINCQWPGYWAYWFLEHGYVCSETLRWQIWNDEQIEPWYRQNLLLFGAAGTLSQMGVSTTLTPLPVVHPGIWAWKL